MRRAGFHRQHARQGVGSGFKAMVVKLSVAALVLLICTVSLFYSSTGTSNAPSSYRSEIRLAELWNNADSGGWKPSSAPRTHWPPPPTESNGYLRVRCNGGLNQQRSAISNAVLAARIMNATLVLPELDANSFWHDDRDAPISWYTTDALKKMKEHGAIYLTPFSHRLAEEIDNPEYQRLRCRVNYHALRCFDIFTPEEQKILKKYREENFAPKRLVYNERRAIGKCPLTPEEVGLILRALGFDNSTRIYLAAGELFGGERFMNPFRSFGNSEELVQNTRGLAGSAVDYMVCLLSDIFMPTYDGPSNFANNLLGHRLYYGFRTTIRPDRKALAPIFIDRENGRTAGFEEAIKKVMLTTNFGEPHKRVSPESFYTNSWPECFCQTAAKNPADRCPPNDILNILDNGLQKEATEQTNSTIS
ncbi:uncharacterized protein DS421_9g277360 [Arachis hypogaea]|nr:uncharacterized protein DS421_9g277360 [Arachis hypogaea]